MSCVERANSPDDSGPDSACRFAFLSHQGKLVQFARNLDQVRGRLHSLREMFKTHSLIDSEIESVCNCEYPLSDSLTQKAQVQSASASDVEVLHQPISVAVQIAAVSQVHTMLLPSSTSVNTRILSEAMKMATLRKPGASPTPIETRAATDQWTRRF